MKQKWQKSQKGRVCNALLQYYKRRYAQRRRAAGGSHGCKNCQNPITWDPNGGLPFDEAAKAEIFAELEKDYISGITFSGGDPLYMGNREDVTALPKEIKEAFPDKKTWLYTGYLWEEVSALPIMPYLDVIVDGRFVEELKDPQLHWKGSFNQRIIDVQKSLEKGTMYLYHAE